MRLLASCRRLKIRPNWVAICSHGRMLTNKREESRGMGMILV